MSVLVVGLSHKGAPLATLERVALAGDALAKLQHDVSRAEDVAGALVLSTCNRVEIYAEVGKFHGAVAAICDLLSRHSGVPHAELTPCLYVHYQDRAVQHLLAVACGLDSMVIGETQILGQLRQALRQAREQGTLGRALADLGSIALRAGKRAQSETGIGRTGASLVSVGLRAAAAQLQGGEAAAELALGGPDAEQPSLAGVRVLVVGAGSMSSLAVASAARAGAAELVVANRTRHRAERLAATAGGTAADFSELSALIAAADLVVTCTGAPGHVITVDTVRDALRERAAGGRLALLDLAMPRDVEPGVSELPGVAVTDLATLAAAGRQGAAGGESAASAERAGAPALPSASGYAAGLGPGIGESDIAAVRQIVAEELEAFLSAGRAARVAPTVVALRAKAAGVVESELARLAGRLGGVDAAVLAEVASSMRRVADKLLHAPTVRVKELAGAPGADSYEDALRVLFDLDPAAVQAVAMADAELAGWPAVPPAGAAPPPGNGSPPGNAAPPGTVPPARTGQASDDGRHSYDGQHGDDSQHGGEGAAAVPARGDSR
jgi:glutamyl-tRNA reductase